MALRVVIEHTGYDTPGRVPSRAPQRTHIRMSSLSYCLVELHEVQGGSLRRRDPKKKRMGVHKHATLQPLVC